MATSVRQYSTSIDLQMMERLKYNGLEPEKLSDLVGLFVSLKNKYGIVPFDMVAESNPIPNAVTARYLVDSLTLNKIANLVRDLPAAPCHDFAARDFQDRQYELALPWAAEPLAPRYLCNESPRKFASGVGC